MQAQGACGQPPRSAAPAVNRFGQMGVLGDRSPQGRPARCPVRVTSQPYNESNFERGPHAGRADGFPRKSHEQVVGNNVETPALPVRRRVLALNGHQYRITNRETTQIPPPKIPLSPIFTLSSAYFQPLTAKPPKSPLTRMLPSNQRASYRPHPGARQPRTPASNFCKRKSKSSTRKENHLMSTPAQIAANIANAQASTGPRSTTGKATCSKNATTHGLFTTSDFIRPGE